MLGENSCGLPNNNLIIKKLHSRSLPSPLLGKERISSQLSVACYIKKKIKKLPLLYNHNIAKYHCFDKEIYEVVLTTKTHQGTAVFSDTTACTANHYVMS